MYAFGAKLSDCLPGVRYELVGEPPSMCAVVYRGRRRIGDAEMQNAAHRQRFDGAPCVLEGHMGDRDDNCQVGAIAHLLQRTWQPVIDL